ncbi:MAG TPA: hypothetical protein VFN30_13785 [Chitinophagaceae bacterium]|nr:hypothetical protein [Chitinophagaceae bacterium]
MRKTLIFIAFTCLYMASFGSFIGAGDKKDSKTKDDRNSKVFSDFKNTMHFSLRNGMMFHGNKILNTQYCKKSIVYNSVITYTKGNTIYIIPHKQSIFVSKFKTPGLNK